MMDMPVHSDDRRCFTKKGIGCPESFPMNLFTTPTMRARCESNHGQSPETLADRGGLGITEMIAILKDEHWKFYEHRSGNEDDLSTILKLVGQ